jgi:nucleotide-binding universal stress UspA family protein
VAGATRRYRDTSETPLALESGGDVPERVLFATDGAKAGLTALRFLVALAKERDVEVEVISVVEPVSDLPMGLPHRAELEHANAQGVANRVRGQIREVAGLADWPVHVRLGRPAPAICDLARGGRCDLILLGLEGRRAETDSTPLEILHLADAPVLVVRGATLPRSAVVGVDFRSSAVAAARAAARLLGPGGTLHLIHVEPFLDFPAASVWDWSGNYDCAVGSAFADLIAQLGDCGVTDIRTRVRIGDPAVELGQAAVDLDADLLAIGSEGYCSHGRVVVGRVARRLLADPPLSILVMPVKPDSGAVVIDLTPGAAAISAVIADLPT